jgi:hypothetical protein
MTTLTLVLLLALVAASVTCLALLCCVIGHAMKQAVRLHNGGPHG